MSPPAFRLIDGLVAWKDTPFLSLTRFQFPQLLILARGVRDRAVEENGLFVLGEQEAGEYREEQESVSHYKNLLGPLPFSPVDTDVR